MKHRTALAVLLGVLAAGLAGAQNAFADPGDGNGKVVFVQTNEVSGNRILVYDRGRDGQLAPAGSYATGGNGGAASPGTESDRLASQGSLAYAPAHQTLLAVNAGSDTVSAFRVQGDQLTLLNVVPSGGQFPNSIGVHDGIAYVLNAGGAGTVQGFRIGDDGLEPIAGSARSLGLANSDPPNFLSAPGQVGFTPDGRWLLVTTKASTSSVEVFRVQGDLLSATPVVNPSATPVPFAFTFGPGSRLVDGEAGTSSVTTYEIQNDGTLTNPQSQSDGQAALCWIDRVHDVYFVSNTGSNTVSSFRVGPDGEPELVASVAATTNPGPIDLVSSGRFLYVETGVTATVDEFRVNDDGTLTSIGSVTGPPGIEGIAAK
jgi:6-phosphogluconolactonase (cycloisomerase 2 family)